MINSNLILLDPLHQFKITLLIGMPGSAFFVYFSFFLILGFYLFFQQVFGFSLIEALVKKYTYTFFFTVLIKVVNFYHLSLKYLSWIELVKQNSQVILFFIFFKYFFCFIILFYLLVDFCFIDYLGVLFILFILVIGSNLKNFLGYFTSKFFSLVFIGFSSGTFFLLFNHLFFSTKKKKFLSVGSFKRGLRKSLRLKKEKVDIEQKYWDWEIHRYYYFKELNELQKNIFTVSKQFFEVVLMVHVIASIKVTKNKLK